MSEALAEKHEDPLCLFHEAYHNFLGAREAAAHELVKAVNEAQFQHRPSKEMSEDPEAAEKLWHNYSKAIRAAWMDSQRAFQAAHDDFVEQFGDLWTKTDAAYLDPHGMAAVSNGLTAVAVATAADIGNLGLFYHTGVTPPENFLVRNVD